MGDQYDIFFSYAHADKKAAKPLLDAFAVKGIKVFHDDTEIIDGQSISRRITDGLSGAKTLVAWYSKTYPTRRACQWELTAAIIAAQRDSSDIKAIENRILALNPEPTRTHIQPLHIQDQRYIAAHDVDAEKLAQQVFDHLQRVHQTFGGFRHLTRPHWFGSNMRLGSNRFVGRVADLWAIHSGLLKHNFAMITGSGTGLVQVQGMGGIGKTLLAEEYALRFGSAYPGGVFWLRATSDTSEALSTQILRIADHLSLETANLTPDQILGLLRRELSAKDPYLWVVDDVPPDAATEDLVNWRAPSVNGVTLVTTRSTQMEGSGFVHRLDVLSDEEALELLTSRRTTKTELERMDAREILELLGNHALAVDVARAAVDKLGYAEFLKRLKNPSADATDFAAKLSSDLPTGHEKQIAATLLDSIKRLDENGLNFLHLAALLAPALIPQELVTDVFSRFSTEPASGADQAILGMDAATREALAERPPCVDDAPESISVHVLVSRTIRFHAGEPPSALRDAVIAAVTDRMAAADDIRNHSHLLPLIAHARALTMHPLDVATATILLWLGRFNYERGAFAEAKTDYYGTLETRKLIFGLEHPNTLTSMNNLASTLSAQGDNAGARAILDEVLAVRRQVQGAEHPATLTSMNNLAFALADLGEAEAARPLIEEALPIAIERYGVKPDFSKALLNTAAYLGVPLPPNALPQS